MLPGSLLAAKAVVFIFLRTDCPVSNRYAPEIQRLYREFATRGAEFSMVYPGPGETLKSVNDHAKQYGLPGAIVLDPIHKLVRMAGVHTTPEAAVFTAAHVLVYQGRIDNRYLTFGKARREPTTHDLEAAISAVLEGKPASPAAGPAIGCAIE